MDDFGDHIMLPYMAGSPFTFNSHNYWAELYFNAPWALYDTADVNDPTIGVYSYRRRNVSESLLTK